MNDRFVDDQDKETMPGWLREILDATRASADLEGRYQRAGEVAWAITQLRRAHRQFKSKVKNLRQHLEWLAAEANVSLQLVLEWFELKEISIRASGSALARLGKDIGLTREEVFVGTQGAELGLLPVAPKPVFGQAPTPGLQLSDEGTMRRLLELKNEIWNEYQKPDF